MESTPDERLASKFRLTIAWLIYGAAIVAIGCSHAVIGPAMAQAEVNITSDSAKGWLPSVDLRQEAVKAAGDYFFELDNEQYDQAYGMMTEINRRSVPLQQFTRQNREFHDKASPLKRRDMLKITWTKDPAAAPSPGVYAAIDVASYFANVERHCGFVILYQKPAGGSFEVMRQEANFIDNVTAQKIELQQSHAALDMMWAKLAANCPNYKSTNAPALKP